MLLKLFFGPECLSFTCLYITNAFRGSTVLVLGLFTEYIGSVLKALICFPISLFHVINSHNKYLRDVHVPPLSPTHTTDSVAVERGWY